MHKLVTTDIDILVHPLGKMLIFYKPEKITLWNIWHFVDKKLNAYEIQTLGGSGTSVLYKYINRTGSG